MHQNINQPINEAIYNPLLFQQNNPLISQSLSLLNSRMKKSMDQELEKFSSKELTKRDKKNRENHKNKESCQQYYEEEHRRKNDEVQEQQSQDNDQLQNIKAVKQFQREIEEKFKISVANKLYTFPRLNITSILDIISSSEEQDDTNNESQSNRPYSRPSESNKQESSQQSYNPFNPLHKKTKTQHFAEQCEQEEFQKEKNFKKVKNPPKQKVGNEQVRNRTGYQEISRKQKQRKNASFKKQEQPNINHSHRDKNGSKAVKKNPQVVLPNNKTRQKPQKPLHQKQKQRQKPAQRNCTNPKQPWAVKHNRHNQQRLKTQMCNDSSQLSDSITESKRKFYQEEFFIQRK